jgi:hypothetical protein
MAAWLGGEGQHQHSPLSDTWPVRAFITTE